MEKTILIKAAAAVIGAAAVVTGAVIAVNRLSGNGDSYRSILVYEVEGTAQINRPSAGVMNAVENLYLESGDGLSVSADSFMRLRLDDDKYVMVEEDSAFSVEATGTKADSKTRINLIRGAIVNEIQNPLSAGSVYQVTTPNSIMAVRGTIFRVEILFDESGEVYTKLSVYGGKVVSRLIFPDGTMDDELSVEAGSEVIIHSNDTLTEYLRSAETIEYGSLPLQTLYVLRDIMDRGDVIQGLTREELEELIRKLSQEDESDVRNEEPGSTQTAGDEEEFQSEFPTDMIRDETESSSVEELSAAGQAETTAWRETVSQVPPTENPYASKMPETSGQSDSTIQPQTTTAQETQPETTVETSPQPSRDGGEDRGDNGGGGSTGGGRRPRPTEGSQESGIPTESPSGSEAPSESSTESEAPSESSAESEAPAESSSESEAPVESSSESEAPTESTQESEETTGEQESTTQAALYTVRFIYQGEEIGIQQVESGGCAARPKLDPAAGGDWDFDFSTEIAGDTEILWH